MKPLSKKAIIACTGIAAGLIGLSGCQSTKTSSAGFSVAANDAASPAMNRILQASSKCWFESHDQAFAAYKIAPELDSYSGRPRILIVPGNNPEGLPLAVIEAQGSPATIQVYGPLVSEAVGRRITGDVSRWARGATDCGASA